MGERNYIIPFGGGSDPETGAAPRALLGARGALLADLAAAGLPVLPGFVISAEVSAYFDRHGRRLPPTFSDELRERLRRLATPDGARYGDPTRPLLLAVCADAPGPSAGVLPPVRNLGLSDRTVQGLARLLGGERAAWDAYRRLLCRYGVAVAGLPADDFEAARRRILDKYGVHDERELDAARLQELCDLYKRVFFERAGRAFPQDPQDQLRATLVEALARWNRCPDRPVHGGLGVAITVRAMAHGQRDEDSAVVRACSRDGRTGEDRPVGVFLTRAQEDDLDAPDAQPAPLDELARAPSAALRGAYADVLGLLRSLERRLRYPPEARFVIERGRTLLLDAVPGRRSGRAGVRWAVDMADADRDATALLTEAEALACLTAHDLESFFFAPEAAETSLLAAFRVSAKDARRHPDYRWYRRLLDWAARHGQLRIYAETEHPQELRLARRLSADGAILRWPVDADATPADLELPLWRRRIEAARAAARELPLILESPAGMPWALPSRRPGVHGLTDAPAFDGESGPRDAPATANRSYILATPRDALLADQAAEHAALLVLDIPRLLRACAGRPGLSDRETPVELDVVGTGQLIEWAVRKARAVRHDIPILARGLSPQDGAGLRFCARAGVTGLTAPVDHVPVFRVLAAQAALRR